MEINEQKKREILEAKNKHLLGDKIVDVKKVTPHQYKKIMGVVQELPGILYTSFAGYLFNENKQDVLVTLMSAGDIAMDEIIQVTSLLTNIEEDYLEMETGLDDLVGYLYKLVKLNNLDKVVKNMVSPLLKVIQNSQE